MKLYIEESSWNGRNPNHISENKNYEYDLIKDVENIVSEGFYAFSFTVTEIGEDFVTINTSEDMGICDDRSISGSQNTFKIVKNEKIILGTLTLDSGKKYTLELR